MSKFDFANAKFMFEIEDTRFSKWFVFVKLLAKSKGTTLRTSQDHSFALYCFDARLYPASSFFICTVVTFRTTSGVARYPIRLCLLMSTFPPTTAPKILPLDTWRLSVPTVKPVSSAASLLGKASGCLLQHFAKYSRSFFASSCDSTTVGVGGLILCAVNRPFRSANRSGWSIISCRRASTSHIRKEYRCVLLPLSS